MRREEWNARGAKSGRCDACIEEEAQAQEREGRGARQRESQRERDSVDSARSFVFACSYRLRCMAVACGSLSVSLLCDLHRVENDRLIDSHHTFSLSQSLHTRSLYRPDLLLICISTPSLSSLTLMDCSVFFSSWSTLNSSASLSRNVVDDILSLSLSCFLSPAVYCK